MTWRAKEDPDDNDDDDQKDEDGDRRSSDVDDIEMEDIRFSQFPPTSLKILDLNNPLRRHCINIILSPWDKNNFIVTDMKVHPPGGLRDAP